MTCIIYKTSFISLFSFSSTGRSKNSVYRVKLCDLLSVHQSRRHFSKQGPDGLSTHEKSVLVCATPHAPSVIVRLNELFVHVTSQGNPDILTLCAVKNSVLQNPALCVCYVWKLGDVFVLEFGRARCGSCAGKSRWPPWAPCPYGLCGRKATLNDWTSLLRVRLIHNLMSC